MLVLLVTNHDIMCYNTPVTIVIDYILINILDFLLVGNE